MNPLVAILWNYASGTTEVIVEALRAVALGGKPQSTNSGGIHL